MKGCGKAYQTKTGLNYHESCHNGTSKIQCEYCGKKMCKSRMNAHLKDVHKMINLFPLCCDMCDQRVKTRWGLKIHKRYAHGVHVYLD